MEVNSQKGQTMVEYILLLSVAVAIATTVLNSEYFQQYFGNNGKIGKVLKDQNEFSYRHAFYKTGEELQRVPDFPPSNRKISEHPSYSDGSGGTRFFGPKDPYGL